MLYTPISCDGIVKIHSLGASIEMNPIDTEDVVLHYKIAFSNGFGISVVKQDYCRLCRLEDLFSAMILFEGRQWLYDYPEYHSEEQLIALCEEISRRTDEPGEEDLGKRFWPVEA